MRRRGGCITGATAARSTPHEESRHDAGAAPTQARHLRCCRVAGCSPAARSGPNYKRPTAPRTPEQAAFVDPGITMLSADRPRRPMVAVVQRSGARPPDRRRLRLQHRHPPGRRELAPGARACCREARRCRRLAAPDDRQRRRRERIDRVRPRPAPTQIGRYPSHRPGRHRAITTSTIYQVGFDACYEVDLFGRVTRSIEAARADAQAAQAALDGARVSVAARDRAELMPTPAAMPRRPMSRARRRSSQDQTLDLTQRLLDAGRGTRRDVDQAVGAGRAGQCASADVRGRAPRHRSTRSRR